MDQSQKRDTSAGKSSQRNEIRMLQIKCTKPFCDYYVDSFQIFRRKFQFFIQT